MSATETTAQRSLSVVPAPRTRAPRVPADHVVVLFGANGDLSKRKLLPGMFHLFEAGLMPRHFRVIGSSRTALSDEEFRSLAREAVQEFGRMPPTGAAWEVFERSLSYSATDSESLSAAVRSAESQIPGDPQRLHYLSVPPAAFGAIVETLGTQQLNERARVILEKPFGWDLPSARALNAVVERVFDESQIFRIDHFLGKEAVQNILALRFANGMFEPVWNRYHIDHVQIDVPEAIGVAGRAAFYESTGAFRDMVVTHLLQVLGFVAMEPPVSLQSGELRDEKQKVFDSMAQLRPQDVVRGQYSGYRAEPGVDAASQTETFVAVRAQIDNWRWSGVPFFLRTGKRMAEGRRLLTIAFREPPRRMFPVDCDWTAESFGADHLTFDLGDPGTISLNFLAKVPGPAIQLGEAEMEFRYADAFGGGEQGLEAYERLIHDVMVGDQTLFNSARGIERLWEASEPVLEHPPDLELYEAGSWGPQSAAVLIAPRRWHLPSDHV
jgi:glucose-6-phosphate 1-dehydrogenase